ncbi:AfsR/SARP family transcriptional regulator [Rhizohabitans arisaemae]|uniref:AfsR/SARP family transcriptional regulator n=1 Tax=Rhizohabitans arisaemae TaxID=2720610 RepID=UPI0024B07A3E|nr:AfsR/SARP family transcriptional regulator [Rhizohabitans arisaemae]
MDFRVLGSLEASEGDQCIELVGGRIRAFLAALLIRSGKPVTLDFLSRYLWDRPPPSAKANLRGYAYALRRALGSVTPNASYRLETLRGGYRLSISPDELDVLRFEQLAGDGERHFARGNITAASASFNQALELWRGRPLENARGSQLLEADIAWLEEQHLAVAERSLDIWISVGLYGKAVAELRRMIIKFPLNERLWVRLMHTLHQSGRRADALATYGKVRAHLINTVGVEPGPELRQAHQAILVCDAR